MLVVNYKRHERMPLPIQPDGRRGALSPSLRDCSFPGLLAYGSLLSFLVDDEVQNRLQGRKVDLRREGLEGVCVTLCYHKWCLCEASQIVPGHFEPRLLPLHCKDIPLQFSLVIKYARTLNKTE